MTAVQLRAGAVTGRLRAPSSKSYTHRAIVAGHLAHRTYRIDHPLDSDDTRATAAAVEALGTRVTRRSDRWTLRPTLRPARRPVQVDCGESGTTLRFVAALAGLSPRPVTLRGRGRLPRRPMDQLLGALGGLGATVDRPSGPETLPVLLCGPIHAGSVTLDASESSQFASGLLLVLPTLEGDSRIRLTGPVVSRPYLEATLRVLAYHGIRVEARRREFRIPGDQRYRRTRFPVPGDASSASYFWTAAALTGGDVRVDGIPRDWPQADLAVLDLLERAGAEVDRFRTGARVRTGPLRPFAVDLTDAPDLYPLAGILAAAIPGTSRLRGAPQVAGKESDRRAGTEALVRAVGARTEWRDGALVVHGRPPLRPFSLRGLRDHRMVMSAAVAALAAAGRSELEDADAVGKSFPAFWSTLRSVAGEAVGA